MDRIDPWTSTQYEDYARLREQFGIQEFDKAYLPDPPKLIRRGVVFGQRGYGLIKKAIINREPWAVMTGLMPSGNMHIGHKVLIDQVVYYQGTGADIFVGVADIESYGTRDVSFEDAKELALEQYILTYLALGLKPERCQVYFQSRRQAVKDLAYTLGKRVNWSTMKAIYGFGDSVNMTHVFAPLVQVGDILHVQLEKYGGPRPTLVPVGVDQDPHLRLTRDIAFAHRLYSTKVLEDGSVGVFVKVDDDVDALLEAAQDALSGRDFVSFEKKADYKALYIRDADESRVTEIEEALIQEEVGRGGFAFYPPSSSYHRFMSGLGGGKMSSSNPMSSIFITDTVEEARKKVMATKTGGAVSLEEQKRDGGKPDQCMVYELLTYHLVEDDGELERIFTECRGGERMCGPCKKRAAELMEAMLSELHEKREASRHLLEEIVAWD